MLTGAAQGPTGTHHACGDDLAALHREFARTRDRRLREVLVGRYAALAQGVARRFAQRGESLEDLTQVAMLGLLRAVDRFDPDRGNRFSTYAVPTMVGELKRHFRDQRWGVRVPRAVQETYLNVRQANQDLTHHLGRSPSVAEIAEHLRIGSDQVLEAMEAGGSFRPVPLHEPDPGARWRLRAGLAQPDAGFEAVEARRDVASLVAQLPEREQRIVRLRFAHEMTQSQIAAQVGVSQMQVCRLLARSLETLRALSAV